MKGIDPFPSPSQGEMQPLHHKHHVLIIPYLLFSLKGSNLDWRIQSPLSDQLEEARKLFKSMESNHDSQVQSLASDH